MLDDDVVLRDFIYLDWERVRSLAAQLFRGVPEGVEQERSSESELHGKLGGSALGILKGEAGADYRYFRTENETRSFHHYVYSLVEDSLVNRGIVTRVGPDFDFDAWSPNCFDDGQFILATGIVRLMDFTWLAGMLQTLPGMLRYAHHASQIVLQQQRAQQMITQQRVEAEKKAQQQQMSELKSWKLDDMTELIRKLYGSTVRIKLLPSENHPDKVLAGSGPLEHFQESSASLAQKYGYDIDAGWLTLGQVNCSNVSEELVPMPIGNEMEDAFEQAAFALNSIIRVASAPKFPAISFTPISIYRTCAQPNQ